MASGLYDSAREKYLGGDLDWDADTVKAVLVDVADYTVDLAVHEFLSDVPAGARVATSSALTGKTKTDGVADADDVTFSAVTGDPVEAVVLYKDTGSAATSSLIAYIDQTPAGALSITPNGGDITIRWQATSPNIFKL